MGIGLVFHSHGHAGRNPDVAPGPSIPSRTQADFGSPVVLSNIMVIVMVLILQILTIRLLVALLVVLLAEVFNIIANPSWYWISRRTKPRHPAGESAEACK